jgi:hypothetical protein
MCANVGGADVSTASWHRVDGEDSVLGPRVVVRE